MNHGLHARQSDLGQLVFGREQSLLRLKHGEKIGGALAVLKLGYLESLPCGIDFVPEVLLRLTRCSLLGPTRSPRRHKH